MIELGLDFHTSHRQFYLVDKSTPFETAAEDFWDDEAFASRLAVGELILGIGTECYGPVKGRVQVLEQRPKSESFDTYDHVVEGSLNVPTGELQIYACLEKKPENQMRIVPATYRVRIYSSNLQTVDGDSGDDFYLLQLWPEDYDLRAVLKQFNFG